MKSKLLILFSILLLLSCSSINKAATNNQADEKKEQKIEWNKNLTSLELEGTVSFENPNMDQSAKIVMMIGGDDSLSATVYGPLGITVGKIYINPETFIFYNALKDEAYEGNPKDAAYFLLHKSVDYRSLIRLFRSDFLNDPTEYKYVANKTGTFYAFTKDTSFNELVKVNDKGKMTNVQIKTKNGELTADFLLKDYTNETEFQIAEAIQITIPPLKTTASFEFDKIRMNETFSKPFSFTLSKYSKVKRITK